MSSYGLFNMFSHAEHGRSTCFLGQPLTTALYRAHRKKQRTVEFKPGKQERMIDAEQDTILAYHGFRVATGPVEADGTHTHIHTTSPFTRAH